MIYEANALLVLVFYPANMTNIDSKCNNSE